MFNHFLLIRLFVQVVEDLTQFYKETFSNYQTTKQEALKETLRGIHFGVRAPPIFFSSLLILADRNGGFSSAAELLRSNRDGL